MASATKVSILSVVILALTGCGTARMSRGELQLTPPPVSKAARPPLTATATESHTLLPSEPSPKTTPTRLPSPTGTPKPSPTAIPSPAAKMAPTQIAPKDQMPRVLAFSAEPVDTESGEGTALRWKAVGEKATLCPLLGDSRVGCRCLFDVSLTGSHTIEPSEIIKAYTGFELVIEAAGIRTVRYTPLSVDCPDRFAEWFFDDSPGICPRESPVSSYAAAQRFEHGLMIWVQEVDEYFVLLDHHRNASRRVADAPGLTETSRLRSLRIVQGPLVLKPGASPDNRVGDSPPTGYFEPLSGFGLVWRGEVEGRTTSARYWAGRKSRSMDSTRSSNVGWTVARSGTVIYEGPMGRSSTSPG